MAVIYPATCGNLSRADAAPEDECKASYKGKHVCRSDHDHGGTYHRCLCGVIWKVAHDKATKDGDAIDPT